MQPIKPKLFSHHRVQGFGLVSVLISVLIFVLISGLVVESATTALRRSREINETKTAQQVMYNQLMTLRHEVQKGAYTPDIEETATATLNGTDYQLTWEIKPQSEQLKAIDISVTWGEDQSLDLESLVYRYNWEEKSKLFQSDEQ